MYSMKRTPQRKVAKRSRLVQRQEDTGQTVVLLSKEAVRQTERLSRKEVTLKMLLTRETIWATDCSLHRMSGV